MRLALILINIAWIFGCIATQKSKPINNSQDDHMLQATLMLSKEGKTIDPSQLTSNRIDEVIPDKLDVAILNDRLLKEGFETDFSEKNSLVTSIIIHGEKNKFQSFFDIELVTQNGTFFVEKYPNRSIKRPAYPEFKIVSAISLNDRVEYFND